MASDDEQVMWELSSGLPLEGQRVHVVGAEFTYRQDYKPDALILVLNYQPVDEDSGEVLDDQEPKEQYYSVGNKYEPGDEDGTYAVHKSGKFVSFNNRSNIGRLIHSYMTVRGKGDADKGLAVVREEGKFPHKAEMYLGLDVTLGSVAYEDQDGKERTTLAFTEYHGRVGKGKASKSTTSSKSSKAKDDDEDDKPTKASGKASGKSSSKKDPEDVFDEDHGGKGLIRRINKAAIAAKDHDAFMDAVLDWEELNTDDKAWNKSAEKLIMDYEDGSMFASAREDA